MIHFKNVKKEYKKKLWFKTQDSTTALSDVSFEIDTGEIVGYIGGNGAGKSTTLKLMLGIITSTSGEIWIDGVPINSIKKNQYLKSVGIVYGQRTQLWWDLPLIESYKLIKEMYEIPDTKYNKNLMNLLKMMELENMLNVPVRTLSLGQRVKADLIAVLLYEPKILFLDEALNGVDTKSIDKIIEFLKKLNKDKKITIIFTSHNLGVVERLCNRIILLEEGKIKYDGKVKVFKQNCKFDMVAELEVDKIGDFEQKFNDLKLNVDYKIFDKKIELVYSSNEYTLLYILKKIPDINVIDIRNNEIPLESLIY